MRCALDLGAAGWLVEAGDLEGARRVLESALGNSPHDVRARALLAQVHFRKRDFVAASEVYERLLGEFPGDLALTFNVALCHLKSGRPGAAAAGLRLILDKCPDHPRARVWLRAAEAATPVPPAPSIRPVSQRPDGVEDIPRITLRPRAAVAKDANGIVSLRVSGDNHWLARPDVIQGYEGEVALGAGSGPLLPLQGDGTTFLRSKGALFVLELRSEEAYVRASALVAHTTGSMPSSADPEVVGAFDEPILHFSGDGEVVLEARADLVALPVSLTHATTVRWDNLVAWRGHVIGAPSDTVGPDGRALARFAGNGSLLLAMHDDGANAPVVQSQEWYGRYQVLRRLEGTPTEEVLLARSHGPGGFQRKVVLRRHLSRCDGDSHYLQLLAREADAYALLTHPGIVRLYDFLLLDGHPVLVLEYVSGLSLSAFDAIVREGVRRVGVEIALYVAHGIFSALAAAHEAREPDTGELAPVVHRDVRPENVMLSWTGDVKLGSFGAAKAGSRAEPRHTVRGDVAAASLLLYRMLISGRVSDPSLPKLEVPRAGGEENLDDLDASRPELSPPLREALRGALSSRDDGRA
ncbi:MAG TPA: tetratricopeptide repeat protein, partial [Polyangiaceae bacterium]